MRSGSWLLLLSSLLLAPPSAAQDGAPGRALQRRTLVLTSRPEEVPLVELYVAAGVATLVQVEAPSRPELSEPERAAGRIQLSYMSDGSLVIVPTVDLPPGEQVVLSGLAGAGARPLRFSLVTRRDAVDLLVRVVPARPTSDDDAAELMARHLLAAPDARSLLVMPQRLGEFDSMGARAHVESVLWMGRRLFATVASMSRKRGVPTWTPVRARLRATLSDGFLLEWSSRILSGTTRGRGPHLFTSLLPEGASRLEVALDGTDAPGDFHPLSLDGMVLPP